MTTYDDLPTPAYLPPPTPLVETNPNAHMEDDANGSMANVEVGEDFHPETGGLAPELKDVIDTTGHETLKVLEGSSDAPSSDAPSVFHGSTGSAQMAA